MVGPLLEPAPMSNTEWADFNDATPEAERADVAALRSSLLARIEGVLSALLPAGKVRHGKFFVGDVDGAEGDSLEVTLNSGKEGLWIDRATGQGGDIFDLIAAHHGLDARTDFPRIIEIAEGLAGAAPKMAQRKSTKTVPVDDLGPETAHWDYLAADGTLLARVYRYDPPGRRKEFRPWDAKRRRMSPPTPRPLYNQPGMLSAERVVLVEGEKSAQALIDAGICATTAIGGAAAPIDKTDWAPLKGKHVLIWPDRDKAGWDYALRAAEAVTVIGAQSCALLMPPVSEPEGWDAADAVAEGKDVRVFLDSAERVTMQPKAPLAPATAPDEPAAWASEDFLALAFTRLYAYDWSYVAAWAKWLVWTGKRWHAEATLHARHLIRHICREISLKADSPKLASRIASNSTVNGVERLACTDRRHAATAEEWDADLWLLNTPNGVVELVSGRIRDHRREDRMTKMASASPQGDCPTWRMFLHEVTGGDLELQGYLARMAGYCLTGSTREHALFFVYGTGANGKSVFLNTLASILGDYATNAPMDTFMETRSDRHPTDMAGLRGARLVTSIETEQGRRWAESKIKGLTGGDKVSARFMRQDFFEYLPQFKLVIAGNHKPAIRNIDESMRRRLHLIPFTVTIPPDRRDKNLASKLLLERDGILAWMVAGCLEWQRIGLQPPRCIVDATDAYFDAEDALGQWIEERCEQRSSATALMSDLYADWRDWAERAGEFVGSVKRFSENLNARRFEKWRSANGHRGLRGLCLQPRSLPPPYDYNDR
jgi:putative DNA primase/helicase